MVLLGKLFTPVRSTHRRGFHGRLRGLDSGSVLASMPQQPYRHTIKICAVWTLDESVELLFCFDDAELNSPVKDARFLQDVAQVDVSIKEVGIERHRLFEVVYRQPDLSLCVEHAAQVAPGHGEVRLRLDRFQVACLLPHV